MTPTTASPHTAWSPGRSSSLTLSLAAPAGDVISHSDFALQCTCVYKPRSVTTLCMHATSQVLTCLWLKRLRVLLNGVVVPYRYLDLKKYGNTVDRSKYIQTMCKTCNAPQITLTQKAHYQHIAVSILCTSW